MITNQRKSELMKSVVHAYIHGVSIGDTVKGLNTYSASTVRAYYKSVEKGDRIVKMKMEGK